MAEKRKVGPDEAEPPGKEARLEGTPGPPPLGDLQPCLQSAADSPGEVPAKAVPRERERDDETDARPHLQDPVRLYCSDATLNAMPSNGGRVLMSLSDGGMQFLIAGIRANVGVVSGRYFFEVKVMEALTPLEGRSSGRNRFPMPRQLVRIGVSLANSSLVMGDGGDGCACFDSEGFYYADRRRVQASARFGRDQDVALLLNLDTASPNAHTISLFCNGQRISDPMPLPEKLRGQPLFPHLAYRNVTLQVNFGPLPMSPLPFKCRMLQQAVTDDVRIASPARAPGEKCEVIFPVGFPDEGTFDWVDDFLDKNPGYTELSDRKIVDWALKSGLWKPSSNSWQHSNDRPEFNFGIQYMDDFSVRRCVNAVSMVVPRNYLLMEVKQNLTPADRKANLQRFKARCFKKVALVVMGSPPAEYRAYVQKRLLEEKRSKAEVDWKMRRLERERRKALLQRQRELLEQGMGGLPPAELDELMTLDSLGQMDDDNGIEEPLPVVELTAEETKLVFRPPTTGDVAPQVLNAAFTQFSIPSKEEGFDEIRFVWQNEEESKAYLKRWIQEKKLCTRIEDLQPGEWFANQIADFENAIRGWEAKQKDYKEERAALAGSRRMEEEEMETRRVDFDIGQVENICDLGQGEPLFSNFCFEDWALLTLRYELHLLQAAFKRDANDPERLGIHENHLQFYYSKYYRKQLNPRAYGKDAPHEVVELVKDAVKLDPTSRILVSALPEEPKGLDVFVKLQEENRRKRQQRVEAGDETARLNFTFLQQMPELPPIVTPTMPPFLPPPPAKGCGKNMDSMQRLPETMPLFPPPPSAKGLGKDLPPLPEPGNFFPQAMSDGYLPSWQNQDMQLPPEPGNFFPPPLPPSKGSDGYLPSWQSQEMWGQDMPPPPEPGNFFPPPLPHPKGSDGYLPSWQSQDSQQAAWQSQQDMGGGCWPPIPSQRYGKGMGRESSGGGGPVGGGGGCMGEAPPRMTQVPPPRPQGWGEKGPKGWKGKGYKKGYKKG